MLLEGGGFDVRIAVGGEVDATEKKPVRKILTHILRQLFTHEVSSTVRIMDMGTLCYTAVVFCVFSPHFI